jgi:hypothetical protein
MATIQKRKNKNGTTSYRVMIRQSDGFRPVTRHFPQGRKPKIGDKRKKRDAAKAIAMGHQTLQMLQRYTYMNAKITHRLSTAVHTRIFNSDRDNEKK